MGTSSSKSKRAKAAKRAQDARQVEGGDAAVEELVRRLNERLAMPAPEVDDAAAADEQRQPTDDEVEDGDPGSK